MEQIQKKWYILTNNENEILTFAEEKKDLKTLLNHANKLLNTDTYINYNKYEKTDKKYNKILLPLYNLNDVFIDIFLLEFDFKNDLCYINGKKYKIEYDRIYTYKILKTKIKAIGGVNGFYDFICRQLDIQSPFTFLLYDALKKITDK